MQLPGGSCSFLSFLVWAFQLDKQSDAKRFFGPMSRAMTMTMTRREMCLLLPAAMLPAAEAMPVGEASEQDDSLPSGSYAFEKLPVKTAASGAQTRAIFKGKLATGESIETHATTLPPGVMPHPPHHHAHSEMFFMREGTLELTVNGKTYPLGPGGVGFVRSNEEHGVKNVGTTPANYFVVEVGPTAG
jgi:mannose-6-phosphate isomerase-like protein (cupin superfamily)